MTEYHDMNSIARSRAIVVLTESRTPFPPQSSARGSSELSENEEEKTVGIPKLVIQQQSFASYCDEVSYAQPSSPAQSNRSHSQLLMMHSPAGELAQ